MKPLSLAGLIGLASLGAQAQVNPPFAVPPQALEAVVVTATRSLDPAMPTLRDTTVITRSELDEAGSLSLAEVLQRRAGIEFRATGGPGQPTGLFIRGANSAQTLVLVDGVRMNSAIGGASVENLPLEMIERIEVVKGPLSGLYGPDAIGGVIQIFTRGKAAPHFFANAAFGTDRDQRISAGVTGVDAATSFSVNIGGRKVDAPSATNDRASCHDPDRDPYENAFFEAKAAHRMWQGEVLSITAFVTSGKTHFDGCPDFVTGAFFNDINKQTLSGIGLSSESTFMPGWKSKLSINTAREELDITGSFPSSLETQHDQLTWVNEFDTSGGGRLLLGGELLRQRILSSGDQAFTRDHRDIDALFAGLNTTLGVQRLEGNVRVDKDRDDPQFGTRTTGSASYGVLTDWGYFSATYGTGFRAPTFFDLYAAPSDFYKPNPDLKPERSHSGELALRSVPSAPVQWRVTAFDNRIEDLIVFVSSPDFTVPGTVDNVARARIKGWEASVEAAWLGVRWRAAYTSQRPRDEDSGKRLSGRAEQFGSLDATMKFNDTWSAGATLFATGDRFDSVDESPGSRLGGYTTVDTRVRYTMTKRWSAELAATNLFDKKHEAAVGYDAPRRGVMLSVRFDAF